MDKFDYITSCFFKGLCLKSDKTSHKLEDICYSVTYKGFVHRIYKELLKRIRKDKQNNRKMGKRHEEVVHLSGNLNSQ